MNVISRSKIIEKIRTQIKDNLLLFTLYGNNYALMSVSVIQIFQTLTITPVANNVHYFVGSSTFRGEVVPVIDLQSFFYGGQLVINSKIRNENRSYVVLDHEGKKIIFQVESVLGSLEMPEDSQVTNLVNFTNPEENPYFYKAFLHNNGEIIVVLDFNQILNRVIYELEESQNQFIEENQILFTPIEIPESLEEYNIGLGQKSSVPVPATVNLGIRKIVGSGRRGTKTATVISVRGLDILVPNDHIVEIFNIQSLTKVPNAAKAVVGAINFRGNVISALSLSEILIPNSTDNKKSEMYHNTDIEALILEIADEQVALLVDEIQEIVEIAEAELRPIFTSSTDITSDYYFKGVMLDHSGHMILVLNVDYLLQVAANPVVLKQDFNKIILFDTPIQGVTSKMRITNETTLGEKLVLITLLGDNYALMSTTVIQILQTLTITPLANTVRYFIGSTTFRGEVVPVIDLELFFYSENSKLVTSKSLEKRESYIALDHEGKKIIFKVESVLGSIEIPEGSQITDLVNLTSSRECLYFNKAFRYDNKIVVLIKHEKVFDQLIFDLEQSHNQFIEENKLLFAPMELSKSSEEYNIDLRQNLSTPAFNLGRSTEKPVIFPQKTKSKGTIVSVHNFNILVPNSYIVEIFNVTNITKVPNSPKAIVGTINFRGEVLCALDLAEILVPSSTDIHEDSALLNTDVLVLIIKAKGQQIALFVDEIQEIIEIDETNLHPILEQVNNGRDSIHYLKSILINQAEQIILVLNIEYLFQIADNPIILEQESTQVFHFKNPVYESLYQLETNEEGLLFEDEGLTFFIDSTYVVQVINQDDLLYKEFSHEAILGAAIHTDIVPLINFSYILRGKPTKYNKPKKAVGILISDVKKNIEVVFLVDNVIRKILVQNFESFQTELGISAKALSPIISGFFSYQSALGMIMSPTALIEETNILLRNVLLIKNIKKEFPSRLLPDEIEKLETIRERRKELELILFYRQKGIRLDFFAFRLQQNFLAFDIEFVRSVHSSLSIENIDLENHPILGITSVNNVRLPIIDIAALILGVEKRTELSKSKYFILLEHQSQAFLVPTINIIGVVTKFKEDLIPCESTNIFLEGKKVCKNMFTDESISLPVYIIENEFITKMLTEKNLNTLVKKVKERIE
ncbi:MAG: chemotaxis protein CheW [Promethearchaeota archaeon]